MPFLVLLQLTLHLWAGYQSPCVRPRPYPYHKKRFRGDDKELIDSQALLISPIATTSIRVYGTRISLLIGVVFET